ncbi:hypothetical protein OG613_48145 (plasmid) [Streptomyces sp. NBC_00015]
MSIPEHERFKAVTIRRPDDVPLSWHLDRLSERDDRLHARSLREDFPHE